ncbi:MAG: DegV family protein [Vulcanimicrobiaceae bacterium]
MMTAVLTDSASDISPAQARAFGVEVVPIWIVYSDRRLRDGVDIDRATFYDRLRNDRDLPFTEPPTEEEFAAAFAVHVEAGREVVAPIVSSGLSKTYATARAAASRFGSAVHVVDSKTLSGGLLLQSMIAADLAKSGASAAEIVHRLEALIADQRGNAVMADMSYLGRSGRINKAIATLGTMLKVCPVLRIANGAVETAAQARTFEKAQELMIEVAVRQLERYDNRRFALGHVHAPQLGSAMVAALRAKLGGEPKAIIEYEVGPGVSVNTGPDGLAIYSVAG